MPLSIPDPSSLEAELKHADLLIFWASIDSSGNMWCIDCRKTQAATRAAAEQSSLRAVVVYVGSREEWKGKPDNPWRQAPFKVQSVPTIVRANKGASMLSLVDDSSKRLVDDDCGNEEKLRELFGPSS